MARYIAFLRAINVGGRVVKMEVLRELFEGFGLEQVETFIASGNVIFRSSTRSPAALQAKIEAGLQAALGFEVATFLRTDTEVAAIVRRQPFAEAHFASAANFSVGFLVEPMSQEAAVTLMGLQTEVDEFQVDGREVYWLSQVKQSESRFSNALFERRLKIPTTFRGMSTLQKLVAKYPAR